MPVDIKTPGGNITSGLLIIIISHYYMDKSCMHQKDRMYVLKRCIPTRTLVSARCKGVNECLGP